MFHFYKNIKIIDTYLTITGESEGFYKEKGSKFIAHAFPVRNEEEVKAQLAALRKQYYDARHHCYAYRIGRGEKLVRANDDGEPSNSAGNPILGQIRSKELLNVLIVVIRYFGGTKLGVGGLINAYRTAAADALENAEVEERFYSSAVTTHFDYAGMNGIMKVIKNYDLPIISQVFDNNCSITLDVRESLLEEVVSKLDKAGSRKVDVGEVGE